MTRRALAGGVLAGLALAAGLAGTRGPGLDGHTVLTLLLATAALVVVAPLCDGRRR